MCTWKFVQQRGCCLAGCKIEKKVFAKRRKLQIRKCAKRGRIHKRRNTDIASKRALIFFTSVTMHKGERGGGEGGTSESSRGVGVSSQEAKILTKEDTKLGL
jgi:hypothetical protein